MGLQDVFFALRLPFDSAEARELSTRIQEEIYLTALEVSVRAGRSGTARTRRTTRRGRPAACCSPTSGASTPTQAERWAALRADIAEHGLRNSLLIAIAPTATIASIAGCYECIEPQVSNLFKRETLSGEFLQVNAALTRELKARGLWTAGGPGGDQAGRGLGAGHRRSCPTTSARCSARRGSCRSGR